MKGELHAHVKIVKRQNKLHFFIDSVNACDHRDKLYAQAGRSIANHSALQAAFPGIPSASKKTPKAGQSFQKHRPRRGNKEVKLAQLNGQDLSGLRRRGCGWWTNLPVLSPPRLRWCHLGLQSWEPARGGG